MNADKNNTQLPQSSVGSSVIPIRKSHNHDHFWTKNNVVFESYNTLRGLRFREIAELSFNYPNHEILTDKMVDFLNYAINFKK